MELVPAQKMLKEKELLGNEMTQWEFFMMGLPRLVLELGTTVVKSSVKDFSLRGTNKKFKYLYRPESYRACLHQVSI